MFRIGFACVGGVFAMGRESESEIVVKTATQTTQRWLSVLAGSEWAIGGDHPGKSEGGFGDGQIRYVAVSGSIA
jgi:hypothetical protein